MFSFAQNLKQIKNNLSLSWRTNVSNFQFKKKYLH